MREHTSWRIIDKRDNEFIGAIVVREDGPLIADCNIGGGENPSSDAENLANARLIAAAPDLLAACEWAASGEHHSACEAPKGHPKKCTCYVGAAQAAIAKATGA